MNCSVFFKVFLVALGMIESAVTPTLMSAPYAYETMSEACDAKEESLILDYNWNGDDNSLLCFSEDGTFIYYEDADNLSGSYASGTYLAFNGVRAINYIASELSEYGLTETEQWELMERSGDAQNALNNYYCIVLNNEECVVDGVNTLEKPIRTPYYGSYEKSQKSFCLVNMNSANFYEFVQASK